MHKNQEPLTRRSFQKILLGAGACAGLGRTDAVGATNAFVVAPVDYYSKLKVRTIRNAAGTYTELTASVMPVPVQRAVAQAALHPVYLQELQANAGEYIAKRLRSEGALVSCGASSALTLATAACIQAANNCMPMDIPEEIGGAKFPKNEIIVQKSHRYGYDHGMFLCGARFVEVVTTDDYRRAFGPKTVMTNFNNATNGGRIQAQPWLEIARERGTPCHIDIASDVPPIENLWKYTAMGFDLVSVSGGKGIRGPQNAGLLLGKRRLVDLATANNNPSDGVGRSMKVAKEQIVGMVAAVDWILQQTDEGLETEFKRREDVIWKMLKDIPTLTASTFTPPVAEHAPVLVLTYDTKTLGITPAGVQEKLRELDHPIELATIRLLPIAQRETSLGVSIWMLLPGEEVIVAREIRKILRSKQSNEQT